MHLTLRFIILLFVFLVIGCRYSGQGTDILGTYNAISAHDVKGVRNGIRNKMFARDAADLDLEPVVHYAAKHGSPEILNLLYSRGFDMDKPNEEGRRPLHLAASAGQDRNVAALLKLGVACDAQDLYGCTPLHYAHNKEVAGILLRHGASLTIRDKNGDTPVGAASSDGDAELFEFLQAMENLGSEHQEEVNRKN